MILKKQTGGLMNPKLTGAMLNYGKPLAGMEPAPSTPPPTPQPTVGDKIHDTLSDLGTGVATWGTSFRKPTQEELTQGRSGWAGRVKLLTGATTQGLVNTMIAGGLGKLSAPALSRAAGRAARPMLNKSVEKTVEGTLNIADGSSELRKQISPYTMQVGGLLTTKQDSINNANLKGLMTVPGAGKAFFKNKSIPGTIGGIMGEQMSTVSPDRRLPEKTNPNVQAIGKFTGALSGDEMGALLNTTANPFGKQGWLKNVVFNPKVNITKDKLQKGVAAGVGLYNLNKQGYKFSKGGTI